MKRINVTLPQDTVQLMDNLVKQGDRSRFINKAVRFYIDKVGRANVREQLQKGAQEHAGRDIRLSEEWFSLEDEAWK